MRTTEEWRNYVGERLRTGEDRMDAMQSDIKTNTAITTTLKSDTEALKADTEELLGIMKAVKGGLRVLEWLGTVIKWVGGIAGGLAALIGLWHMITGGIPPPK